MDKGRALWEEYIGPFTEKNQNSTAIGNRDT